MAKYDKPSPQQSKRTLLVLGLIGLTLSSYGVYVEHQLARARITSVPYKAGCDFEDLQISCSRALSSNAANLLSYLELLPKGHPLDLSNAEAGLLFYSATAICPFFTPLPTQERAVAMFLAASATLVVSFYLAFVMFIVLNDLCLLCLSMDIINVILFTVSLRDVLNIARDEKPRKKDE